MHQLLTHANPVVLALVALALASAAAFGLWRLTCWLVPDEQHPAAGGGTDTEQALKAVTLITVSSHNTTSL
jgi:hypothetical protein